VTYMTIRPSSFYFDHFPSSKNFNHITKHTNVFHLKLGDNHRFNHFSTFTFSKHTSHQQNQSIANYQFLTYKYRWPITSVCYGHEKIFTVTLNQIMSYHLSLFLNLTPLYISLIYGVCFNKAFQDCSFEKLHIKQCACSNYWIYLLLKFYI